MLRKIRKRVKEDHGNAVIVLGIMLLMALMMVGALLLDVSKAHQLKSSYVDGARKATQAAVMEQRADGGLKPEAAAAAIHWYENIIRPTIINEDSSFSKCVDFDDDKVEYYVTFTDEAESIRSTIGPVTRAELNGANTMEEVANRIPAINHSMFRRAILGSEHTTIQLEVQEATTNVIMPAAFAIGQANAAHTAHMKCQVMQIGAKSTIFTGSDTGSYE